MPRPIQRNSLPSLICGTLFPTSAAGRTKSSVAGIARRAGFFLVLLVSLAGCGGGGGDPSGSDPTGGNPAPDAPASEIRDTNTPPTIEDQELNTLVATSIGGTLVALDPESDRLKYEISTQPEHGTAELDSGNGSFVYIPNEGFSGTDSFKVTAADGMDTSAPAQITISVEGSLSTSPSSDTSEPSLPEIASVVNQEDGKAKFYWLPAEDDQTNQNRIQYALYIENTPIDDVSGLSPKSRTLGTPEAMATVEEDAKLYALVTAQDEAGNVSLSTQYDFISSRASANVDGTVSLKRDVDLHLPDPEIQSDRLKYSVTGSQTNPTVGDYLVGSNNGGYLRKVVKVTEAGNNLEVETAQARVADVFSEFSIGGQTKLVAPPSSETEALSRETRYTMRSANSQRPAVEKVTRWPSGGLSIIDSQPAQMLRSQTGARALTSGDNGLTINVPTVDGAIAVMAGDLVEVSVEATVSEQDLPGQSISQFEIKSIEQGGENHTMASLGMSWIESGGSAKLRWRPKAQHVAEDLTEPYEVTLIAVSKTNDCWWEGQLWSFCSEKTELTVPIYVSASHDEGSENSSFSSYGGNFSADLDVEFEPSLITDLEIDDSTLIDRLETATLSLRGDVGLSARIGLTFGGEKTYEVEKTIVPERHYVQVYAAGPVPVVQVTTLSMKAALVATADGAISLEETFDVELGMEFGVQYNSGDWTTIQSANKDLDFNHTLEAEANVSVDVRLIPDVSISFYSVATAGMSLQPYLSGELGADYQMLVNSSFDQTDATQLYRLKQADAELGLEAGLYAALNAVLIDIARYPNDGYHIFELIEPITLFSLPQAQLETSGAPSHTSQKTMLVQMTGLDGQYNGFANDPGTWEAFPSDGIEILPQSFGSKSATAAIRFSRPDEYRLIYHHSSQLLPDPIGRQYFDITLDFRDSDGDGMNNHWETLYGLDPNSAFDAGLDSDSDGMTALEEYNSGFDPTQYTDLSAIPAAPTGVTASPADESAIVEWDPVANALGYRLHLSKGPFVVSDIETSSVVPIEDVTSSFKLTGLENGVQYYISIQAVGGAEDSKLSALHSFTPEVNGTGSTEGLVAHFTFNEGVDDISGKNNHGTLYNGATITSGLLDLTADYDARMVVPYDSSLDITQGITVSAWVKRTGKYRGDHPMFVVKNPVNHAYLLWPSRDYTSLENSEFAFRVNINGAWYPVYSGISMDIGTLYHVVGVRNGNNLAIFVNGQLAGERTIPTYDISTTGGPLTIGDDDLNSHRPSFNGIIDEVRIYNKALTDDEVMSLFELGQ